MARANATAPAPSGNTVDARTKAHELRAALGAIWGTGALEKMPEGDRDDFLGLCWNLADQICTLLWGDEPAAAGAPAAPAAAAQPGVVTQLVDAYDALSVKLLHLDAALAHTVADSFAGFDALADEAKRNYLGMCSDMASDARELLSAVGGGTRG